MKCKAPAISSLLCVLLGVALWAASAVAKQEPPDLQPLVEAGKLPPVEDRVPQTPYVDSMKDGRRSVGRYGSRLRILMGRAKDIRIMVVYGYARLLGYDTAYNLVPDILRDVEVRDDREFTFRLRRGHKWSDGQPFTTEDFRYFWEDMANDKDINPFGVPGALRLKGRPPEFELIDETTFVYRWKERNPNFLSKLAGTRPLFIYAPAHYLKQYHARYQDASALDEKVKSAGARNWAALHIKENRQYKNKNIKLPTLQPWMNTTKSPSQRYVFKRNPYFHRVDAQDRQLPYVGEVIMNIADGKLIPAKTGAGETDLQARHLKFSDYTFLKKSEKRTKSRVLLWQTTKGAHIALFPNLNVKHPEWRKLFRDVRFRRALSIGIDRDEINQVIYYGLARPGNNTIHESSPLFLEHYRSAWAQHDKRKANQLLDSLGLTKRNEEGLRLLPDGEPMILVVETAGEDTEQTDVLELVQDNWLDLGIKIFSKPLQREVFRNRIFAGDTMMSVWGGLENGVPTADMSPERLAPTEQVQYQWPKWGEFYETNGTHGEPVDMPRARELMELNEQWASAKGSSDRVEIWQRMLQIHSEQVYSIGLIAGVPQPVVINGALRNLPKVGVYNWEPGAHFGLYHPDSFWFEK